MKDNNIQNLIVETTKNHFRKLINAFQGVTLSEIPELTEYFESLDTGEKNILTDVLIEMKNYNLLWGIVEQISDLPYNKIAKQLRKDKDASLVDTICIATAFIDNKIEYPEDLKKALEEKYDKYIIDELKQRSNFTYELVMDAYSPLDDFIIDESTLN